MVALFVALNPSVDPDRVGRDAVESRGAFPALFDLKIEILDGHDFG